MPLRLIPHRARRMKPRPDWMQLRPWRRHSLVVGIGGVVYICYGVSLLTPIVGARESSLRLAFYLPPAFWGFVWIIVGLLAVVSTRWPPASETWGYTAMTFLSALWGSFYLCGVIMGAPSSGINGCLVWVLVAHLWWGVSGLRNPDNIPKER